MRKAIVSTTLNSQINTKNIIFFFYKRIINKRKIYKFYYQFIYSNKKFLIRLILVYLRYFPFYLKKGIIKDNFLDKLLKFESTFIVKIDGLKIKLKFPEDYGYKILLIDKNYETGTTELLKRITKENDVIFDIGANIGWYTLILSRLAKKGKCYAFEPLPMAFQKLKDHCIINNLMDNVLLNNLAISNKNGETYIYNFSDLPHSYSSLNSFDRQDFTRLKVKSITLDDYIEKNDIKNINIIKVDVEGSELNVLEGAEKLLNSKNPPIWIFEINEKTSNKFGYNKVKLLEHLKKHQNYYFLRIEYGWGKFKLMNNIDECENADNVICFVKEIHMDRFKSILNI